MNKFFDALITFLRLDADVDLYLCLSLSLSISIYTAVIWFSLKKKISSAISTAVI